MSANDADNNWRVWQNPEVAGRFTERRRGGLLGGDAQLETMLRLIAVVPTPRLTVLDLGCGDGALLEAILAVYPDARGVALDGSTAMIRQAQERLRGRGVYFTRVDFNDPEWTEMLPVETAFDAVVSGFAIHHSEDARKRRLYAEIFHLLVPGGVFVNVENVAPVEMQLNWLRDIGFIDVDCYWKHFELAVLAGYRPANSEEPT